jgi:LysM repeat protein
MKLLLVLPMVVLAQYCQVRRLGIDGYCYDLAAAAGIDIARLNQLNNFDCVRDGKSGQRLCVSVGVLPPPPIPNGKPDDTCYFKTLGMPPEYDGYCFDIAASSGIDLNTLNQLNKFDCEKDGLSGQRLCVSLGNLPPIPDPPADSNGNCFYVDVGEGDLCDTIAKKYKITMEQLQNFNKDRNLNCKLLSLNTRLCVSLGTYPSRRKVQNDPNKPCFFQAADSPATDSCAKIAAANDITIEEIDSWNQKTWQFKGCAKGLDKDQKICVSPGTPASPPKLDLDKVQCGAQHPDPTKFECPLRACCSKFGWCGTTADFCEKVEGPPGLGCQSNCEIGVPESSKVCSSKVMSKAVGYYESWASGRSRDCNPLEPEDIDVSKWTHIHYSFAIINSEGLLDMADQTERDRLKKFRLLKAKKNSLKLIISVGGWSFNNAGTSHIFTTMVETAERRKRFIDSVVVFLNTYGLDGFDMDWEYPTAEDRGGRPQDPENYLALMKEFKANPAFGTFSLSIAAPASYWYLRGFKIAEMSELLDYIVYMA